MEEKQTIMVICAHSDDQILGPGGTIAKYAAQGNDIISLIFSPGELSHPWLKRRITIELRQNEAKEADKVIGGKEVLFIGINESKFVKEASSEWVHGKLGQIIKNYKPSKIFTHSIDDLHQAHRAVYRTTMAVLDKISYKGDAYSFDIWNPLNLRGRNLPKMYVDISDTFNKKLSALTCFKSQWIAMFSLLWSVHLRALLTGLEANCKYAERFYKVR